MGKSILNLEKIAEVRMILDKYEEIARQENVSDTVIIAMNNNVENARVALDPKVVTNDPEPIA